MNEPVMLAWKDLKRLGWPYERTHTWRLIKAGQFPQPAKFFNQCKSKNLWRYEEVKAFLKSKGLM